VGVGIGLPHVTKHGTSVLSIAGLGALVGGLGLLAVAVREVGRRRGPARAVVAAGAIAIAAALVVWTVAPAVAATNVARTEVGRRPDQVGLDARVVRFRAADGTRLVGWYGRSRTGAAVVLLHGAGSTRSNVLDQAAVLARHGYGVLLVDARGHGDSAGRAMDFGWAGDDDIRGAIDFLLRRPDVDPGRIGAVGLSMGGEEAIGAAAALPALRAVVAEGATRRSSADERWLSDVYGVRGTLTALAGRVTDGVADLLSDASPPIALGDAARAAAPRRLLLIAAGDVADEIHAARAIRRASPASVDLWVVPDSGHTDGLRTRPRAWEDRVVGFLDGALSRD
jgi:dienelactone hydrolase